VTQAKVVTHLVSDCVCEARVSETFPLIDICGDSIK